MELYPADNILTPSAKCKVDKNENRVFFAHIFDIELFDLERSLFEM
ncbi:MAG: hypothetical protein MUF15_09550 [Acidobacteria bacterium]|jgi:hypothetical protein|nr:hypothetical protein [Acidobacteriota bacterium]